MHFENSKNLINIFLFGALFCLAQNEKEFVIKSIESNINIDGIGNEKEWDLAEWQSEFCCGGQMIV